MMIGAASLRREFIILHSSFIITPPYSYLLFKTVERAGQKLRLLRELSSYEGTMGYCFL